MAAVAYALLVFVLSVVPTEPSLPVGRLDKLAHLCEYALFAWLLVHALPPRRLAGGQAVLLAWVYATSYGLLMELIQMMVPWRSAELADALANALGAALGVWIGARIPRKLSP